MGIEKRLQLIMVSNRLSASSFADKIGVQRSNVSHVLNGRNKPGYDFLLKVIHAFPKVNTHWLLTGDEKLNEVPDDLFEQREVVEVETGILSHSVSKDPKEKALSNSDASKRIIKTVVFYDDFTFDAFLPSER